jgi:cytochrome c
MKTLVKATVLGAALVWAGSACAAGDAANGEKIFKSVCKMCHQIGAGAKAGIGPAQNGVYGSTAGSRAGFNYSTPLKDAGAKGLVWNDENLDKWLASPKELVPGTKMTFPGEKDAQKRADVIAFLKTQPAQ